MTEAHNARQPKLRVAMATKFPYSESDSYSGLFQVYQNLSNALAQRSDIELFVVSGSDQVEQIEHRQINNYQSHSFHTGLT